MSLVFILGGVVMGLLIGLLVTASINRAVDKIRAVEKELRESKEAAETAGKRPATAIAVSRTVVFVVIIHLMT